MEIDALTTVSAAYCDTGLNELVTLKCHDTCNGRHASGVKDRKHYQVKD